MFLNGNISYGSWAAKISSLIKKTISKQDIWKRVTDSFINFIMLCIEKFMFQEENEEIQGYSKEIRTKLFGYFSNVYIQDSTNLSLSLKLVKFSKVAWLRQTKSRS